MSKSGNPLGPNTRNLTVNVPADQYIALEQLCGASGCRYGEYIRALLDVAVRLQLVATQKDEDREEWVSRVQERAPGPLPKIRREISDAHIRKALSQYRRIENAA